MMTVALLQQWWLATPLTKGGAADGTQTLGESPAISDLFPRHVGDDGLHSPKSVLTARRPPSG